MEKKLVSPQRYIYRVRKKFTHCYLPFYINLVKFAYIMPFTFNIYSCVLTLKKLHSLLIKLSSSKVVPKFVKHVGNLVTYRIQFELTFAPSEATGLKTGICTTIF